MTTTHRRFSAAILAAALVIAGLAAVPAQAGPVLRTISGTVTVPADLPTPYKNLVSAGADLLPNGPTVAVVPVNSETGQYAFTNLAPGVYRISFGVAGQPDANGVLQFSDVISEFYDNRQNTSIGYTPVDVTSGDKTGINATLEYGTTIRGKVTVPAATPAGWRKGITVSAVTPGRDSTSGYINPDGTYVIRGLVPATYKVLALPTPYWPESGGDAITPALVQQYWKNTYDSEKATPVTAGDSGATGINFTMARAHTMSGKVSLQPGADPQQLRSVQVHINDDRGVSSSASVDPATGNWTAKNLPPGSYRVRFAAAGSYWDPVTSTQKPSDVIGEYYNDKRALEAATLVTITSANRTGINATLAVGGGIAGTVTVPEGTPALWWYGISVSAIASDGTSVTSRVDPDTGTYRINKVPPGKHSVQFNVSREVFAEGVTFQPKLASQYYPNTYVRANATPVTVTTNNTTTGINATLERSIDNAPNPIVSAHQGKAGYKVNPGTWTPTPTSLTIQWYRDNEPIAGATGEIYLFTLADRGKRVRVDVTGKLAGYGDTVRSSPTYTTPLLDFEAVPVPTITGKPAGGHTLTAKPGAWTPKATAYTYQWLRAGTAITGATKGTYKLTAADAGKAISVTVTASTQGYAPASATSQALTMPKFFSKAPAPTVTGTAKVGKTLTAKAGTWSPKPTKVTYQWLRNGKAIKGATKATYKVVAKDRGTKITVRTTATKSGYGTTERTSKAKAIPALKFAKAPVPTVTGTAKAGKTLTAKAGAWSPKPTTVTYQWLRNGKAINGATKATYKLTASDKGKKITVKVTAKKSGYKTTAKTSKAKSIAK